MRTLIFLLLACVLHAASLIATANGNLTAAATWKVVDTTSLLDSESATTTLSTTPTDSATFTPGAITIDGIAVKLSSRAASPSGTFTIALRDTTAGNTPISVNINVSDVNASGNGWYMVTFTATPLTAGHVYDVRLNTSVASQVTVFRNATAGNWSRMLRTTTTQAPAAGDQMVITGEWTGAGAVTTRTVTMDSTATTIYGATTFTQSIHVGNNGTLTYGTSASTNYVLKMAGILGVYGGGEFDIGTSGTPIPSTSSATLQFSVASNVDSGLVLNNGSTFNAQGATKTTVNTLLTADIAAAATVLHVASTSGWAANDLIGIASTTRTPGDCEEATILTVDSTTQVTLTAGVGHAHSGTSPTQAEIINLTRNVLIEGTSTSLQSYMLIAGATVSMVYAEMKWFGSGTSGKRGMDLTTGTTNPMLFQYCAFHDWAVASSRTFTTGNIILSLTVDSNGFFGIANSALGGGQPSGITFTNNILMRNTDGNTALIGQFSNGGSSVTTITGNTIVGATGSGCFIHDRSANSSRDNNTSHSNASHGFEVSGIWHGPGPNTTTGLKSWRNGGSGIAVDASSNLTMTSGDIWDTLTLFGNTTNNFLMTNYSNGLVISNSMLAGDSTFGTTNGINFTGASPQNLFLVNNTIGVASGIFVAHTTDLAFSTASLTQIYGDNTTLASATPVSANISSDYIYSFVRMQNWNGAGGKKSWFVYGTSSLDTTSYGFSSGFSERLTPNNASNKLQSSSKFIPVANGGAPTITVKIRESVVGDGAAYNGNPPRLIVKRNYSIGITSDTVLATFAGSAGAVTTLSATLPTASADGMYEVIVDCDGTAGWVNDTDWSTSSLFSEPTQQFWTMGLPGGSAQRPIAQTGVGYATIQ